MKFEVSDFSMSLCHSGVLEHRLVMHNFGMYHVKCLAYFEYDMMFRLSVNPLCNVMLLHKVVDALRKLSRHTKGDDSSQDL